MLMGCGRPYGWVLHAEPNPFVRPGCRAVLEPIHNEQLLVGGKPEAQYVAEKKADSADSYDEDKRASEAMFGQVIMGDHPELFAPGTPDNTFTIRPVWLHWEPGFFTFFVNKPAEADFVVDVLAPNGQPLNRISIHRVVGSGGMGGNISSGGRMRTALQAVAHVTGVYISDNWLCAAH